MIKIRKITKRLEFADYAPEYGPDDHLLVWVNPPREKLLEYEQIREENETLIEGMKALSEDPEAVSDDARKELAEKLMGASDGYYAWFAEIWSQGPDETTHQSAEMVKQFATEAQGVDPQLWIFAIARSWALIQEHLSGTKKD